MIVEDRGRRDIEEAESAHIVEDDLNAVVGDEKNVVMLLGRRARFGPSEQAPGHAEMADHDLTVVEREKQVFAAPADGLDTAPFEAGREIRRQRKAQIATPHRDARYAMAFEHGRQATADGLDFGKLGHVRL